MSNCFQHSDKSAKFKCSDCGLLICDKCVKSFHAGEFMTYFCPACNSQCDEITNIKAEIKKTKPNPPLPTSNKSQTSENSEKKLSSNNILNKSNVNDTSNFYSNEEKDSLIETEEITEAIDIDDTDDLSDLYADKEDNDIEEASKLKNFAPNNIDKTSETIPLSSTMFFPIKCLFNPKKAFENSLKNLQSGIFYRIKLVSLLCLLLISVISFEVYKSSFLHGIIYSLISLLIFSSVFTFGIKIFGNVKSMLHLFMQISVMWLFIQFIQHIAIIPLPLTIQPIFLILFALCFTFINFWIFGNGISFVYEISVLKVILIYILSASLTDPILYYLNIA